MKARAPARASGQHRFHRLAHADQPGSGAYIALPPWWNRVVVMGAKIHGWSLSPSHFIGQDLETARLER